MVRLELDSARARFDGIIPPSAGGVADGQPRPRVRRLRIALIDSSAVLAIFFREPGAEELLSTILDADFVGIGSPTAAATPPPLGMLDNMANMVQECLLVQPRAKQEPIRRPASDVKGRWRDIVDEVNANGEVVVTNYNRPAVVVVSMERYAKLKNDAAARDPLVALRAEFDRELAVLRQTKTPGKLRKAFASTPAEIARAANAAIRRKR